LLFDSHGSNFVIMKTFSSIQSVQKFLVKEKKKGKTIGFVPTMGALHEGHLQLMRRAKKENDLLVVSIFVNPIQFNNPEDLKKYPRNLAKDRDLLETVGCDSVFAPTVEEMYPEAVTTKYDFGKLENVMEGAFRKGHFNGVAIVVKKLFDIVTPDKAYFGEKDFQQLAIIQELVRLEKLPVQIVPCAIVREKDGLAMSSRNERLSKDERASAPYIHKTLKEAVQLSEKMSPGEIKQWVTEQFAGNKVFQLEYFEIADDSNLQPISAWNKSIGTMGFVAVQLGKVRLIDNIRFI
jgi:pantoate--beta-alanine ligase